MQRLELSSNDKIKLLTREPLLIVRLPILYPGLTTNTMWLVRNKPYQYHTFALSIPLDLDYDDLVHLSRFNLLGEVLQIVPPYSTMGGTLFENIFTYPW
jgi:hypothetical protein